MQMGSMKFGQLNIFKTYIKRMHRLLYITKCISTYESGSDCNWKCQI